MGWWISNTTPNVSLPSQDSHDWGVVKFAATEFKRNRIYRQLSSSASPLFHLIRETYRDKKYPLLHPCKTSC